jgi:biotin operon repressor
MVTSPRPGSKYSRGENPSGPAWCPDGNYGAIPHIVVDLYAQHIGPMALLVYVVLARRGDYWTGQSYPSTGQIAKLLGIGKSTVKAAIHTLVDYGLLDVEPSKGGYHKTSTNIYTLPIPPSQVVTRSGGDPVSTRPPTGSGGDPRPGQVVTPNNNNGTTTPEQQQPPPPPSPGEEAAVTVDEFVGEWRKYQNLTQPKKMTARRRKALRARSADPDWVSSWKEALARAAASKFCTGGGDRGWRADVDWFLRPDVVVKILEGKYDKEFSSGHRTQSKKRDQSGCKFRE